MNELVLPVTSGTLPGGACPTDFQSLANLLAANFSVTFPSTFKGVIASSAQPTDTTQAWAQLDSNGRFVRLYTFAQGKWLSPHQIVPGFIMIWPSALPDFTTFDGGDSGALGSQSGPMWQLAQDGTGAPILQAQFPVGVGTLPSTTPILVGGTGGEEAHSLITAELAPHQHGMTTFGQGSATQFTQNTVGGAVSYLLGTAGPIVNSTDSVGGTGTTPVVTPHNTLPPFYGVYFLQRTSRLFFAV